MGTDRETTASDWGHRMLVENSPEALLLTRPDGQILAANSAACRLLGRNEDELRGLGRGGVMDAGDARLAPALAERARTGRFVGELTCVRSDGTRFPVELASSVFVGGDGEVLTSIAIRDLTAVKAAEAELRLTRERLEIAIAGADLGTYDVDRAAGRITVDRRYLEMLGYAEGEVAPTRELLLSWIHADDRADVERARSAYERGETPGYDLEYRVKHKDGRWVWIRDRGRVVERDADGAPHRVVGTHLDVTEQRVAELALRASEARFRSLLESARFGMGYFDLDGRLVYFNSVAAEVAGGSAAAFSGKTPREIFGDQVGSIVAARLQEAAHSNDSRCYETCFALKSGERWFLSHYNRVLNPSGAVTGVQVIATDITDRRRTEDTLRDTLEWQRRIFEGSRDAVFISDESARFTAVNAAAEQLTGFSRDELLTMRIPDLHEASDLSAFQAFHARILAGESILSDAPVRRKDGSKVEVEFSNSMVEVSGRRFMHTVARDLSGRRLAEAELRASQERYQRLFTTMSEGFALHEIVCNEAGEPVDYRFLDANTAFFELTGLSPSIIGRTVREVIPEIEPSWIETYGGVALTGIPRQFDQVAAALGRHFEVRAYSPQRGRFATVFFDVTERSRAQEAERKRMRQLQAVATVGLKLSARLELRDLLETAVQEIQHAFSFHNVAVLLHHPETGELGSQAMAGALAELAGPGYRQPVGTGLIGTAAQRRETVLANDVAQDESYVEGFPQRNATRSEVAVPITLGDEVLAVLDVQETTTGAFDESDVLTLETLARVIAVAIHNSRLFASAQHELAERGRAEEEYRQLFEAESDAILLIENEAGRILAANSAAATLYGYSRDELLALRNVDLSAEAEQTRVVTETTPVEIEKVVTIPLRMHRKKDGTVFPVEITGRFFERNGSGVHIAAIRDITERRRAEEALRASEEQLRHAQKMEAVGRLAGGVAHDFNNLLQAMLSYTTLLRSTAADPSRVPRIADEIVQHIHRGASLTRQLLLFSRRSATRPEPADLNALAKASGGFLRHLLRENIAFAVETTGTPLLVSVDPSQFDQVLMNLAINASDAMPAGGRLAIRVADRGPALAEVSVQDSGHGIAADLHEVIFEPFFTTKEAGHGTGLGLSVVHGIVAEHGGRIEVESEVDAGTTFRILLPRLAEGPTAESPAQAAPEVDLLQGRGERVLVVEDEEAARQGLAEILGMLGYQVAVAGSAEEASALEPEQAWDLLLTDLLLPGATGITLAGILTARWPGLRIVVMSGYAEDEEIRRAIGERAVRFLQKPFDMNTLARELRAALDGARS